MRGDIVAVYPVGGILVALAGKGTEKPAREPGEREIYSRDKDGKKAATHSLKTGGGHFIGNSKANMRETLDKVFDALTVFTTGLAAQNLSEKAAGLQASLSEIKIYAADFLEAQP
jgi:hypothetical protein